MDSTDIDKERESSPASAKATRGKPRRRTKTANGKQHAGGKSGKKPANSGEKTAAADRAVKSGKSATKSGKSAGKSGKSATKSGKSAGKAAGRKPGKPAAKPAREKPAARSGVTQQKATGTRTKPAGKPLARGKKRAARTAAAGDLPLLDPPPVELPPVPPEAGDDPKSLSWMAAQAVSALNAVKANQAEKGKLIMARAEKEKAPEEGDDVSRDTASSGMASSIDSPQSRSPVADGITETDSAGQPEVGSLSPVTGTPSADDTSSVSSRMSGSTVVQPPAVPPEPPVAAAAEAADSGERTDTQETAISLSEPVAVVPAVQSAATRPPPAAPAVAGWRALVSPQRIVAALAIIGVLVIGFWRGGGEGAGGGAEVSDRPADLVEETLAPDGPDSGKQDSIAERADPEPAAEPAAAPGGSGWTPATLRFPAPKPQTAGLDTSGPPVAETNTPAVVEGVAAQTTAAAEPGSPPADGTGGTAPVVGPVAPPAPPPVAAPAQAPTARYGYFPPQGGWQPPYYRPAYARPAVR